ncbi:DUF805 domain-containing protein [Candidatus Kaiserbacteria bacterium]|nr:DUF805 domain-containing protein [Candidatus Kaiserbacteria bacterium]
MHWLLDPIRHHYADFDWRATRKAFWLFSLWTFVIYWVLSVLGEEVEVFGLINLVVSLALILPSFAIGARRLHDIGKSGWWQFLWIIPIIGWIILLVWFARKSSPTENKYGPVPQGVTTEPNQTCCTQH